MNYIMEVRYLIKENFRKCSINILHVYVPILSMKQKFWWRVTQVSADYNQYRVLGRLRN